MRYIAVVAVEEELGIGRAGNLAWQNSEDLQNFKRITSGHTIIMGATTYFSIGRPLPNRRNMVLSHGIIEVPGIEVFESIESLFTTLGLPELSQDWDIAFVIGGAQIYTSFLQQNYLSELWISHIPGTYDCDVFFPEFRTNWKIYETKQFKSFELRKYIPVEESTI